MVQLKVVFLGTSAAAPTEDRNLSSIAILRGGELFIFDAGEGMQRALIKAGLGLNRKTRIFITHLHGDHCIGLLGLLQTMALAGRQRPLEIYGPKGIEGFIRGSQRYLRFNLTFDLAFHRVKQGILVEEQDYTIRALRGEHSITTYAYCLEERRPGLFYPERAKALGIPEGRLWGELQKGRCIEIEGRIIRPEDVMGPPRRGRKIGISGDTRPVPRLVRFFEGCDLLIFDSTYGDEHADKALENLHSTAREAATLAKRARVKRLVLTHFSARYDDVSHLVEQARSIFPQVIAAEDLMSLEIPFPD